MVYITAKTSEQLKDSYLTAKGNYPSLIGHGFGYAAHGLIHFLAENLCKLVDEVFPDGFPFGTVQNLFIAVFRGIYGLICQAVYNIFAEAGDSVQAKFAETIEDFEKQIKLRVIQAREYIEANLINPMQEKLRALESQINAAQGKLDEFNRLIDNAKKTLYDHESRLQELERKIPFEIEGLDIKKFLRGE